MNRLADDAVAVKVVDTFVATFSMGGISQKLRGINIRFRERYKINKRYGIKRQVICTYYVTIRELTTIIYRKFINMIFHE